MPRADVAQYAPDNRLGNHCQIPPFSVFTCCPHTPTALPFSVLRSHRLGTPFAHRKWEAMKCIMLTWLKSIKVLWKFHKNWFTNYSPWLINPLLDPQPKRIDWDMITTTMNLTTSFTILCYKRPRPIIHYSISQTDTSKNAHIFNIKIIQSNLKKPGHKHLRPVITPLHVLRILFQHKQIWRTGDQYKHQAVE